MASHRYTQDQVEKAVQLVRSKQMSLNGASKAFGIPYATLGDKVRGRRPMKAAPKTVLSCEEETKLVKWLIELSRRGFGRTKKDLKDMVKRILDERGAKTVFTDNRPGKDWMLAFFKRHTVVSERMAQPLGRERAVVTRDGLSAWFGDMKEYVDGIDPTLLSCPERIFNADESGFSICPKTKRVITMMGTKHVYSVTSGTRQQVTVLACSSAVGQYIPPLLIFPYTRDPRFNALEGFEDAFFQKTPNGWITEEVFFTFLRDIFIPSLKSKRPVVLFVDGHSSHHSMAISTLCEENGIILYCLKAHASHIIQPLDQAFFGTIKPAWNEAVRKYQYETGESITMRTFARTLKKAWDTTARPEIALKGFAKSGIFPFSPETVLSSDKLAPSCSFTSMAAASVTSSNSPSSGKPEQLSSSTTDFPTCSQPSASTSNDSSTPRSSKPERARPHVPSAAAVSNLFQLIKFNFSLGEKTVTKFMKRYEEQYNMENSTYIKWKSLMDKSLNQSPQPAASAQDIQPSTSAQDIQPSTSAQDIQPSTSAQDIQPSTSAQDIQPSTSAQDIQPSTSAQDIQPSTSAQDIQPSTSQLLPEQQSPSSKSLTSPAQKGKTIDELLVLPTFPKKKGVKKASTAMPFSISGAEYREMLQEKQRKKDEEERQKEERKRKREERKKEREEAAVAKKQKMEENKQEREKKKKDKEEKKKRNREAKQWKAILAASQKQMKDSSDSGDEPLLDDDSDDMIEEMNEQCMKCKHDTRANVRVQCVLCDSWWHAQCVSHMDLTGKAQEDIKAMDVEFFCEKCSSGRCWTEVAERDKLADCVIIATPDRLHKDPAVAFANKGYHILLEKPMAVTEEDCREIASTCKARGVLLAVCHVLRYVPWAYKIKEVIASGDIGQVVNIQHTEPVGFWHFAHSFVRGNWRNEEQSCSSLLAKCCHDADLIHYWLEDAGKCVRVSSFGSLAHFRKEDKPKGAGDRCTDCSVESQCPYSAKRLYLDSVKQGNTGWPVDVVTEVPDIESVTEALRTGPYGRCVYSCDNDVMSQQVTTFQFENGATASLTMMGFTSRICAREVKIYGTKGEIRCDALSGRLHVFDFLTEQTREVKCSAEVAPRHMRGHSGADYQLIKSFVAALKTGNKDLIRTGADDTLSSHLLVFAAEKARKENRVVEIQSDGSF
ncbi:hypothetical protein ACOMHN_035882 [Nucella lapillus]